MLACGFECSVYLSQHAVGGLQFVLVAFSGNTYLRFSMYGQHNSPELILIIFKKYVNMTRCCHNHNHCRSTHSTVRKQDRT